MTDWQGGHQEEASCTLGFQFDRTSSAPGRVFSQYPFLFVLCLSLQVALATKGSRNRQNTRHSPLIRKTPADYDFWEY